MPFYGNIRLLSLFSVEYPDHIHMFIGISEEEARKIERLIKFIERNICEEGLYQKSSSGDTLNKYYSKLCSLKANQLDPPDNVHMLTTALKKYIKELRYPLLPRTLLDNCLRICGEF